MSKLDQATQKLAAALRPTHHRRIEPMPRTRNIEIQDNVDHSTTEGMVSDTKNQLEASIEEWEANVEQLQEEIDRLQDLISKAEKARDSLGELEGEIA